MNCAPLLPLLTPNSSLLTYYNTGLLHFSLYVVDEPAGFGDILDETRKRRRLEDIPSREVFDLTGGDILSLIHISEPTRP